MLHYYYTTSLVPSFTFFVVISARPYTTEVGPDVLNARGSFPTDVHQVLIPRSHTHIHKHMRSHTHARYLHTCILTCTRPNYNAVRQKKAVNEEHTMFTVHLT